MRMADRDEMHMALEAAKDRAKGASSLARSLCITPQAVNQWFVVPPERVLDVERLTGISRHLLRPDVFGKPQSSPVGSSAGEAGALSPPANPSDAPAISEQGRAEVAHRVHTPEVAGSNPVPATSFNSPGSLLPSGENAGAQHSLAGCAPAAIPEGLR